ncbi:MAG: two-component regulator propeller domain-containing protein [Bacteroidia bacterium]
MLILLFTACRDSAIDPIHSNNAIICKEIWKDRLQIDTSASLQILLKKAVKRNPISKLETRDSSGQYSLRLIPTTAPDSFPAWNFNFIAPQKNPIQIIMGAPKKVDASPYDSREINPHGFSLLGIRQGLPDQSLRAIIQDHSGFIWLAHQRSGITRFDGTHFFNFSADQGLPSNDIFSLCTDSIGNIWIGSNDKGLFCFDGYMLKQYTVEQGLCSNSINTLYTDSKGRIWAGSNEAGISIIEKGRIANFNASQGAPGNIIWRFLELNGGIMAAVGTKGISFIGNKKVKRYTDKQGLPDSTMWSLNKDSDNNLIIGTPNVGLLFWNHNSFYTYDTKVLKNASISDLEWRSDSSLWLAIYGQGIARLKDGTITRYGNGTGISGLMTIDLLHDKEGSLWVSSYGSGLSRLGNTGFYHISQAIFSQKIKTLLELDQETMWMGSSGAGIIELKKNNVTQIDLGRKDENLKISCLTRDTTGNIWVGTVDVGLGVIDNTKSTVTWFDKANVQSSYITDIHCDRLGTIWVATENEIFKWVGKRLVATNIKQDDAKGLIRKLHMDISGTLWVLYDNAVAQISKNEIRYFSVKRSNVPIKLLCLKEDVEGDVWIGTEKDGAIRMRQNNLVHYTTNEGLLDNSVFFIQQDYLGNLIFGHALGLSKMKKPKYFNEPP